MGNYEVANERKCGACINNGPEGCRKWQCDGVKTIDDVKREAVEEFANKLKSNWRKMPCAHEGKHTCLLGDCEACRECYENYITRFVNEGKR